MFIDLMVALDTLDQVQENISGMDHVTFLSWLGLVVDVWSAEHELTSDETISLLEELTRAAAGVHDELGVMEV